MYQNSELERATIRVMDLSNENGHVKITDEAGNIYSFFHTKKSDGSRTKAYDSMPVGLALGDTVEFLYKQRPYKDGHVNSIAVFTNDEDRGTPGPKFTGSRVGPATAPSRPEPIKPHLVSSPMLPRDVMIGVLALMKVANVSLEQLEKPETWSRFVQAYRTGREVIAFEADVNPPTTGGPNNSTQGDIRVEDL